MTYDVVIAGGGPAGTSAAITAAGHGLSVLLCERAADGGSRARDKVCGEFVSPEALSLLQRWTPELLAQAPLITRTRLITTGGTSAAFALPKAARGISRLTLDAALWRAAAAAGVQLRARTTVAQVRQASARFQLLTATGEEILARHVVWAAGRQPAPVRRSWLGIKARFAGLPQQQEIELYGLHRGYCGVAPVENGWTNVCCLLAAQDRPVLDGHQDFARWLSRIRGSGVLCARLQGAQQVSATVVTAGIGLGARAPIGGDGSLCAGDASGFVDPFTGDGIARALLSGQAAASAVAAGSVRGYPAALQRASRRSFRTGAWLRAAVLAPAWLQAGLLPLLAHPLLGQRLVAATRWRAGTSRT